MATKDWNWSEEDVSPYWIGYVEASTDSQGLISSDNFELYFYDLVATDGDVEGIWESYAPTEDYVSEKGGYTYLSAYYASDDGADDGDPAVYYATEGYDVGWSSLTGRPYIDEWTTWGSSLWYADVRTGVAANPLDERELAAIQLMYNPDDISIDNRETEMKALYDEKIDAWVATLQGESELSNNTLNFKKAKGRPADAKEMSAFSTETVAAKTVTVSTTTTTESETDGAY